ncbi:MAG: hypothetical protein EPN79_11020 [Burkholderiaceae bacterium]|nr:MAG: hypothetical protein EPN79_11020 [Burkholderiaceae bacterium]TBR76785.1 MAG: hypothetical protein EPN64_06055 [Burkholderiaceae bacterium]
MDAYDKDNSPSSGGDGIWDDEAAKERVPHSEHEIFEGAREPGFDNSEAGALVNEATDAYVHEEPAAAEFSVSKKKSNLPFNLAIGLLAVVGVGAVAVQAGLFKRHQVKPLAPGPSMAFSSPHQIHPAHPVVAGAGMLASADSPSKIQEGGVLGSHPSVSHLAQPSQSAGAGPLDSDPSLLLEKADVGAGPIGQARPGAAVATTTPHAVGLESAAPAVPPGSHDEKSATAPIASDPVKGLALAAAAQPGLAGPGAEHSQGGMVNVAPAGEGALMPAHQTLASSALHDVAQHKREHVAHAEHRPHAAEVRVAARKRMMSRMRREDTLAVKSTKAKADVKGSGGKEVLVGWTLKATWPTHGPDQRAWIVDKEGRVMTVAVGSQVSGAKVLAIGQGGEKVVTTAGVILPPN